MTIKTIKKQILFLFLIGLCLITKVNCAGINDQDIRCLKKMDEINKGALPVC
jgi:hypothetical protein